MMKKYFYVVLALLLLSSALAVVDGEELYFGAVENSDSALKPLVDLIRPLLVEVSVLVGGIFGLYIILILVRIHYERKKVKILEDIRYDLDRLNMHYNLAYSGRRLGILKKIFFKTREFLQNRKFNRESKQRKRK